MGYEELLKKVTSERRRFDEESTKHKRLYRKLRVLAIVLTGLATVLGGASLFPGVNRDLMSLGIVFVTAATGIVASIEAIRKPSELWMIERNIFHTLSDLRRELEYYGSERLNQKQLDAYFARLQEILYSSRQEWRRNIKVPQLGTSKNDGAENA
ncbi:MAG: DUF4231 domain-containing protein [Pyrinomonadaceae bacterium]